MERTSISRPGRPSRTLPDRKRNNSCVEVDGIEYDLTNLLSGAELIPQDPVPVQPKAPPAEPPNSKSKSRAKQKAKNKKKSSLGSLNIGQHRTQPKKGLGLSGLSIGSRSTGSLETDADDCESLDTCEVFRREKAQFDQQQKQQQLLHNGRHANPERRQSPYRFDIMAMQTLMTSFSDIPELNGSFRLSKHGQVLSINDDSDRFPSPRKNPGLLGKRDDDDDSEDSEDEEDLFGFAPKKPPATTHTGNYGRKKPAPYHPSMDEVPGRCSASTISNDSTSKEPPASFHDSAINDLIYDQETGTYVYREEYLQDDDSNNNNDYYHQPQSNKPRSSGNVTLEEMCEHAQNDDGVYDDEAHEMEISPGIYVPFRGAKETWQAVATKSTVDIYCLDCNAHLVCVNDCEYTVCPDCRVVNPIYCDNPKGKPFGVGMGFKKEWVLKREMLAMEKERRGSDHLSLQNRAQRYNNNNRNNNNNNNNGLGVAQGRLKSIGLD